MAASKSLIKRRALKQSRLDSIVLSIGLFLLASAGAGCQGGTVIQGPFLPVVSSISPTSSAAGSPAFTLTVNGSNFDATSVVQWNGVSRTTSFVSATRLTADISAADIFSPVAITITVNNPSGPNAGLSNSTPFTITSRPPGSNVGIVEILSEDNNGNPANNRSGEISLNADGRFAAFDTFATNLVSPPPPTQDIYLHDTCVGVSPCSPSTSLVSVANGTTTGGNNVSSFPSISGDGRFIAFLSDATNLVAPSTSFPQAYLRDTCRNAAVCTPSVLLASLTTAVTEPNGAANAVSLSANGRFVVFQTQATNVVPGVTIPAQSYLRDLCQTSNGPVANCTAQTILISADNAGLPGNNSSIPIPVMSADGRFVAFESTGSNLPGSLNNQTKEVYLRDTCGLPNNPISNCAPTTFLVSANGSGIASAMDAINPSISGDGRYVSFASFAQLAPGSSNQAINLFLRDTCQSSNGPVAGCSPSISTVSVGLGGAIANGGSLGEASSLDATGRHILFASNALNLVNSPPPNGGVYVRDTCIGAPAGCTPSTVLVSVDSKGNFISNLGGLSISSDGHYCTFVGVLTNGDQAVLALTGF
jgi:hypothetical protein